MGCPTRANEECCPCVSSPHWHRFLPLALLSWILSQLLPNKFSARMDKSDLIVLAQSDCLIYCQTAEPTYERVEGAKFIMWAGSASMQNTHVHSLNPVLA